MEEEEKFSYRQFFDFEKRHNLFEKKRDCYYIWDIIRSEVYLEILWNYTSKAFYRPKRNTKEAFLFAKEFVKFFFKVLFSQSDYLFFSCSRNRKGDKYFDQNLSDIYQALNGEKIEIESFQKDASLRLHNANIYSPILFVRKILKPFMLEKRGDREIFDLICNEFPSFTLSEKALEGLLANFFIDKLFYKFIFKRLKPKVIFITQNGIQKGLFAAAKECCIPVVEVQHGIIDPGHIVYNYSKEIDYLPEQLYTPTHYLTFSDFWMKDLHFPFVKTISVGNTSFYNANGNVRAENNSNGLLVASSDLFGEELGALSQAFATREVDRPIYFKLHPNQFNEVDIYKSFFSSLPNVSVITNEHSIPDLLEICEAVLVIQSTAIYEALHLNKKGIIYKRKTYNRHSHIFHLPNVYLIGDEFDLEAALNDPTTDSNLSKDIFFQSFDLQKFADLGLINE